jgi:adenosine deaminase
MLRAPIHLPAAVLLGLLLIFSNNAPAQHTPVPHAGAAARAYAAAQKQGPLALHAFLVRMPKGADLHMHLSGAIYAETWLSEAAEDGLCIDPAALSFDRTGKQDNGGCKPGEIAASEALKDQHLYDQLIDAFSMRTFVPVTGESGHDHFFATFERFGGVSKKHWGAWLDEVATRAARQNEQYLEIMETPDVSAVAAEAEKIGFQSDLAKYRDALLPTVRAQLPELRKALDQAEHDRRSLENCDGGGTSGAPLPACQVQERYLFQVLRGMSPARDFAQILEGFEFANADPRVVGLNLVRPEDGLGELESYRLDMKILATLRAFYPKVHITLHAGELAPGMAPPRDLLSHIEEAVYEAHAERIGHGVDVMYENHPYKLMEDMAAQHVMVEINLTSNDVILNVKGDEHPLPFYMAAHVPVALSTDDEGVSRIDLTHEYVRAAVTYHLTYDQLKQMVRTSIEHSFLPGASLWRASTPETLTDPDPRCRAQMGLDKPAGTCAELVNGSEKAQQQWELERRFHAFEASF